MANITQEELKQFLTWVFGKDGVQFGETLDGRLAIYRVTDRWIEEDEEYGIEFLGYDWDTVNLTFLFKWAVPKIRGKLGLLYIEFDAPYDEEEDWLCKISSDYTGEMLEWRGYDKDLATALFRTIQEVIKND